MEFSQLTFSAALPEFFLIALALVMVLVAAFARQTQAEEQGTIKLVRTLSLLGFFAAFLAVFSVPDGRIVLFNDLFAINDLVIYMKGLILVGAFFASWLVSEQWGEGIDRAEFHLLVLIAVIGMLLMVSANDLISLYMALELQSLPLYVVAAMRTSSLKSSEAGLKYFLLGALSSGLLLYGASLVYGFSGSTNFDAIASSLSGGTSVGMVVGMVFLLSGLAFKISAAPFHMWTPDVYEGAPTPVTALFAIVPKVAGMTLLMNVTYSAFGNITDQWVQILIALSVASMIVGATGTLCTKYQADACLFLYRAYGLCAGRWPPVQEGASAVVIYMTTYVFMGAAAFGVIMTMRREGAPVEKISDLSGLSATHPLLAAAMMIVMFSMAGIPPLAGFFGKWYVFLAAVNAGLVPLAVIGVLTSVIGAFYYLRIIRLMYFQDSDAPLDEGLAHQNRMILVISVGFILLFFFGIGALSEQATSIVSVYF